MNNDHLYSNCIYDTCRNIDCDDAVKKSSFGRWFITMGHAGYNSPANNNNGYRSKKVALFAMKKYLNR